jgi:hypothetical protein
VCVQGKAGSKVAVAAFVRNGIIIFILFISLAFPWCRRQIKKLELELELSRVIFFMVKALFGSHK